MESRWFVLGKLDLSDEAIVGVGQTRTAAEIVCYSGAICASKKLLKGVHGTQVVSVHWQRLAQRVLQYIALDRMDVVFATILSKRVARYLIGH